MINTYTFLKDHKEYPLLEWKKCRENHSIESADFRYSRSKTLALTSIGRDGEEVDVVTSTHKPKIFVYPER